MSATIHWRPATDEGKTFDNGTSSSYDRLIRACGSVLDIADVPKLRAMAVAADNDFYNEVANTIEKVVSIKVWRTY